jgi:hypothetical protein
VVMIRTIFCVHCTSQMRSLPSAGGADRLDDVQSPNTGTPQRRLILKLDSCPLTYTILGGFALSHERTNRDSEVRTKVVRPRCNCGFTSGTLCIFFFHGDRHMQVIDDTRRLTRNSHTTRYLHSMLLNLRRPLLSQLLSAPEPFQRSFLLCSVASPCVPSRIVHDGPLAQTYSDSCSV